MKKTARIEEPGKPQELADELRLRQSNVLPPDVISNDRDVDDVLWNGPTSRSKIQRVGAFVIGFMLFTYSLAAAFSFYKEGARLFLFLFVAIAAAGLRVIYMSLKRRVIRKTR